MQCALCALSVCVCVCMCHVLHVRVCVCVIMRFSVCVRCMCVAPSNGKEAKAQRTKGERPECEGSQAERASIRVHKFRPLREPRVVCVCVCVCACVCVRVCAMRLGGGAEGTRG